MSHTKHAILFARDLITELPATWSWARTRHCERTTGHHWTEPAYHPTKHAIGSACRRCKYWQPSPLPIFVPATTSTGSLYGPIAVTDNRVTGNRPPRQGWG